MSNASVAGLIKPEFQNDSSLISTSTGRFFLLDGIRAVMHDCEITHFELDVDDAGDGTARFALFRGGSKEWISPAIDIVDGYQLIELDSSVSAQDGDKIGVWLSGNGQAPSQRVTGITLRYASDLSGDNITLESELASSLSATSISFGALSQGSYSLCGTGDSISEGHNVGPGVVYHSYQHHEDSSGATRIGNVEESCPGLVAARLADWGFENHALGSQTFAWVLSDGAQACVSRSPDAIWIHCGVNDALAGRTWAQVESDLDGIRAVIPSSIGLILSEILPATSGSDAQSATIRTWNANISEWCSSNNATLLECHDSFGQIRGTTGELDDLKTAYDYDGIHLSQAGVDALAVLLEPILAAMEVPPGYVAASFPKRLRRRIEKDEYPAVAIDGESASGFIREELRRRAERLT